MLRTIISVFILIAGVIKTSACSPYDRLYTQDQHTTFRLFASLDDVTPGTGKIRNQEFHKENLKLWQQLSSPHVSLADIDSVVYTWDIDCLSRLVKSANGNRIEHGELKMLRGNSFARWIIDHKDTELAQYLLLAKDCERVIESQNSLWYYYVNGDEQSQQLSEMARRNASSYKGKRLADRYALLQIRALFASKHYEECIKAWEKQKKVFHSDVLRDKAEGYVAGAYARTDQKDLAKEIYARLHDYESLILLSNVKKTMERLTLCATLWPNDEYTLSLLQEKINSVEEGTWFWWPPADSSKCYAEILKIVKKILQSKHARNSAEWNYAAAFLEEELGQRQSAFRYLRKARRCKSNADLKDAMHVLDTYMRVKYAKAYDDNLEKWLLGELVWMSGKAKENFTPQIRKQLTENALWHVKAGLSVYY